MKIEHVALNVSEPSAIAAWYVDHLGMTVAHRIEGPAHTHFLADEGGTVMLEVYCNPPDAVPDYASMDPLILHVAFVSDSPAKDRDRLISGGATLLSDTRLDDGSHLVMLRDPWGLAIQLCKRTRPMI